MKNEKIEIENYFNSIKKKLHKVKKLNIILGLYILLFLFSVCGAIPAYILASLEKPMDTNIFLILWIIFGSIEVYSLYFLNKKIDNLPYTYFDKLFYYAFSAYQNIELYLKSEDPGLLYKASKFFEKCNFDDLRMKIKEAYDIPGIHKTDLKRIDDFLLIIEERMIPRLVEGKELEKIKLIIEKFAYFFYAQKQDIDLQEKIFIDLINQANKLEIYKAISKFKLRNIIINKTYLSQNLIIRTFSFVLSILFILSIAGYILYYYFNILMMSYYIIGAITVSFLVGVELARSIR